MVQEISLARKDEVDTVQTTLSDHVDDTDNPHETDLEQARQEGNEVEGDIDMGGNNIINVSNPNDGDDVATKEYVDGQAIDGAPIYVQSSPPDEPEDDAAWVDTIGQSLFFWFDEEWNPIDDQGLFTLMDDKEFETFGHKTGRGLTTDTRDAGGRLVSDE